jgi:hypothetical protein
MMLIFRSMRMSSLGEELCFKFVENTKKSASLANPFYTLPLAKE